MHWLNRLFPWLLVALTGLGLQAGCSTFAPQRTSARSYHDNIAIKGRFSVSYQTAGRPQSAQGRFQWLQRGEYLDIDLLSPLGQTQARIAVTPALATIQQNGGEARYATDVEALTTGILGWSLPVNGLREWLQGYARRPEGMIPVAAPGGKQIFDVDGWQVRYVSWQQDSGTFHPKRIDLERNGSDSVVLSMRIVIDGWEPD